MMSVVSVSPRRILCGVWLHGYNCLGRRVGVVPRRTVCLHRGYVFRVGVLDDCVPGVVAWFEAGALGVVRGFEEYLVRWVC